jgi:hypothetical protein
MCAMLFFSNLGARLLARSQYSEGPATGHLERSFSWFPCIYKQMLSWFPGFQVATTAAKVVSKLSIVQIIPSSGNLYLSLSEVDDFRALCNETC